MWKAELLFDRELEDGRFVVINNSTGEVPLGTVFVTLQSRLCKQEDISFHEALLTKAETVSLEMTEIESWRELVQQVPKGHNAAVRLVGDGIAQLKQHLLSKRKSVHVFLSAGQDAA